MAVQTLDTKLSLKPQTSTSILRGIESTKPTHKKEDALDARRRLEEKIEQMRLDKETLDFDLDYDA